MKKIVAIQGVRGAFHQEAAEQYFGNNIEIHECLTFRQLIDSVELGEASHGVMAIENSLVGGILPNYALIRDSSLKITGEIYMRIEQNLIASFGETLDSICEVRSHPMAIAQCANFFRCRPSIKLIECEDTALSAKQIADLKLNGVAIIASRYAAQEYGLEIIEPSIESNKENYTRFLILEKKEVVQDSQGYNKASISFTALHQPGSLLRILQPLSDFGVNLTMLQSLPIVGRKWEYIFHADLVFLSLDELYQSLEIVKNFATSLDVLGVYHSHEMHEHPEKEGCLVHYC